MNAVTVPSSALTSSPGGLHRTATSELGEQDTICYVYPDGRVVITHRKHSRAR